MRLIPSFTVGMDICHVLYLSYLVPRQRLRPAVPEGLDFAVAGDSVPLSLVMFRSSNVRASFFPFLRFSYDQVNIRTYVKDPVTGKEAVFFLKSGITSPLVSVLTGILGIPWHLITVRLTTPGGGDSPFPYAAEGVWKNHFRILLHDDPEPVADISPFQSREEAIRFLTAPTIGFYGSSRGVVRFEVDHSAIRPFMGRIETIDCPILSHPGFVAEEELRFPHSVLVAPHGRFTIFMPPSRLPI